MDDEEEFEDYENGHDTRGVDCKHPPPSYFKYFGGGPFLTPDERQEVLDEIRSAIGGQEAEEELLKEVRRDLLELSRPPNTLKVLGMIQVQIGGDLAASVLASNNLMSVVDRVEFDFCKDAVYRVVSDLQERLSDGRRFSRHEIGHWLTDYICLCDACWK